MRHFDVSGTHRKRPCDMEISKHPFLINVIRFMGSLSSVRGEKTCLL